MKEATGDLNMTVIVVLIVAGLVAFFSMVIGPMITKGIKSDTNCADAVCKKGPQCPSEGGICECTYRGKTIKCPYKG